MMLDRGTLKQDKTCGRGLITDPIAHVVTDAVQIFEQNQPSGIESIKMHLSLTFLKYGNLLVSGFYAVLSLVRYDRKQYTDRLCSVSR